MTEYLLVTILTRWARAPGAQPYREKNKNLSSKIRYANDPPFKNKMNYKIMYWNNLIS